MLTRHAHADASCTHSVFTFVTRAAAVTLRHVPTACEHVARSDSFPAPTPQSSASEGFVSLQSTSFFSGYTYRSCHYQWHSPIRYVPVTTQYLVINQVLSHKAYWTARLERIVGGCQDLCMHRHARSTRHSAAMVVHEWTYAGAAQHARHAIFTTAVYQAVQ